MLERYGHGGDLRTAEESFGLPADRFTDFSSNMNPLGPPPSVKQALAAYADIIGQYPDPAVRGLRRKLAMRHQLGEHAIVIGNGAAELIDLVVRAIRPRLTVLAIPCFDEYGDAVRKIGGAVKEIVLSAERDFELEHEFDRLCDLAEPGTLFMLGSPNNPTGRLVEPGLVMRLIELGASVVVDEAFMDFVPEEAAYSLIHEASRHERLFVIRSMTKFYSIPGIRLGYIAGNPKALSGIRRLQVPWSVNSLAQLIGEAVLEETEFAGRTMEWLLLDRPWLISELEALGFRVFPSSANYLLVRIPGEPGMSASKLQLEMGKLGVLIRDASRFPGLDHTYIRVAVKRREQNVILLQALEKCIGRRAREQRI
ncbi:pyridoxal phosphate-dependent aminotransferase [Paenibacillus harenae]|uniref:pyridoxal phosphate-dependent aminotransferase n=1 Tax=Paenibacillus harenae TaxID=306543 RepID=UPI000423DDA6|nr:threonine-phosphate decarboxylase [Paenibacillus harenae]